MARKVQYDMCGHGWMGREVLLAQYSVWSEEETKTGRLQYQLAQGELEENHRIISISSTTPFKHDTTKQNSHEKCIITYMAKLSNSANNKVIYFILNSSKSYNSSSTPMPKKKL
jgi:hypothetical protein